MADFDQVMGDVMIIIIMGGAIIFLFWGFLGASRIKEEKRKELVKLQQEIPAVEKNWNNFIITISAITEASCKCNLPTYRLFEIFRDESIEYRCLTCSMKNRHSNVYIESAMKKLGYEDFKISQLLSSIMTIENKLTDINRWIQSDVILKWQYESVNRGPWCRGIRFQPSKISEESTGKRRRNISTKTKQIVWERDQGVCVNCFTGQDLEYDHIIPFSKGGSNGPNNIQLLCRKCNSLKRAKII